MRSKRQHQTLCLIIRGNNTDKCGIHVISIPKKVHRPKVVSQFESIPSYPDVDEGYFLHESFGKAVFRPKNWDVSARDDIITYDQLKHKKALDSLIIVPTTTNPVREKIIDIITSYLDVYVPEAIKRHILGYEFKIDTGTSKGVCCRPPSYGHYEGEIIMNHVRALLDNTWIRECIAGSYGVPIVLAPKPHQEEITDIKDFVWRMYVSYRALNKVTAPFEYHIGRCDDAIENLGDGAGKLYFISIDYAQGYHQIRVWCQDQEKLSFFGPDEKKYT